MHGCGRTQKWKKMQHSQRTILVYYCCGHKDTLPFLNFLNRNFSTWSWSASFTDLWGQSAKTRLCVRNNNELRVLEFCSFFNPSTKLIDYRLCFYCLLFTPWLVLQYLCHVCHCLFNFLRAFQGFSSVKFCYPAWPSSLITFADGLFVQSTSSSFDCLLVNWTQQLNLKDFIDLILLWVLSLCINITEIHCWYHSEMKRGTQSN